MEISLCSFQENQPKQSNTKDNIKDYVHHNFYLP